LHRALLSLGFVVLSCPSFCLGSPALPAGDARSDRMTDDQNQILDRVREYSKTYTANLPNFVCIQITQQFLAKAPARKYEPIGEYRQRLNYVDHHETYERIETRTIGKRPRILRPFRAYSRGEFGTLMQQVLATDKATFTWLSWETIQETRAAVFAYRVDLAHTTMHIQNGSEGAMTAYHGLVFAKPADGTVLRITSEAEGIPPQFEFRTAGNEVDYGEVIIAGKSYLLPTLSIFSGVGRSGLFRNETEFVEYQKFSAESELKLDPQ
jgi:hypothetical protein